MSWCTRIVLGRGIGLGRRRGVLVPQLVPLILLSFLLLTPNLFAQATIALSGGPILTPYGTPATNAPIRVCLFTSLGTPCSTAGVTLYSDQNRTQPLANPTNLNSQGVYNLFTTAGNYIIQIQVTPTLTHTFYSFQTAVGGTTLPAGPAFAVNFANSLANAFQGDSTITINPTTHVFTAPTVILSGVTPGTGTICANGTGGALTNAGCLAAGVTASPQFSLFYQPSAGTSATAQGDPNATTDGSGNVAAHTLLSAGSPTYDIRHPSFSGGAACNNTHDDQPAFQAMINALFTASPTGGEVFVCPNAYFSNPTTISWPTFTGSFTITFQGKFRSGTTFVTSGNGLSFNIKCMSGGQGVNFQSGQNCNITENSTSSGTSANHGTLGTAVSTTPGTGATVTFTPSTMSGLFAGTYITVTDTLTCTPTAVVRASNIVTATMPSSCKIPPGIFQNLTVAGMSDSSFNGTSFSVSQSDYVLNTVTWAQTGSNGSTSGGTIAGFNEDTPETIPITSCTVSTCTATFYRPHLSTATWGVVGFAYINNTGKIDDASFSTTDGTSLYIFNGDFALTLTHMGAAGGASVTNFPLEMDQTSFIKFRDSSIAANNQSPWGLWLTSTHAMSGSGTGNIELDHTPVSTEVKIDHLAVNLTMDSYSFIERPLRGNIVVDPSFVNSGIASPGVITVNNVGSNDPNGYGTPTCSIYYTSPSTVANPGMVYMQNSQSNATPGCAFNDYFNGNVKYDSNQRTALITPRGPIGTYDDGKVTDSSARSFTGAAGPANINFATQNIPPPTSWSGAGCTITTGQPDPLGGTNAATLTTASSSGSITIFTWSGTPAVGDQFLFAATTYSSTLGTSDAPGAGWGPFALGIGSGTFTFTVSNPASIVPFDSEIIDDYYHTIAGQATIATASGGAGTINFALACDNQHTQFYFNPVMIYIPASANVPVREINRLRRQLQYGAMPSNWNHPGVAVTSLPLASVPSATTITGTSGTALCSQGFQGTQKYTSCYLNGYAQTGTAQTFTFPVAFATTPVLLESGGSCGTYNPSVSSTVLTLPANAAMTAETCNVVVLGQ